MLRKSGSGFLREPLSGSVPTLSEVLPHLFQKEVRIRSLCLSVRG